MNYANLTNEELLQSSYTQDRMVTSELELELAKRFAEQGDENSIQAGMLEVLQEFDVQINSTKGIEHVRAALQFAFDYGLTQVRNLMETASEYDIDTAELLKPRLELAAQIDAITDDVSDGIAVLNKIFNPTTATT